MKIYMMGVCGTGMGNLAIMLKQIGHDVIGSDTNIYPPMSTQLESAGIKILAGYNEENIKNTEIDVVVIGNVVRKTNPEAEYVLNNEIEYISMAEALNIFFMKDKNRFVVTGTHGKTTTSFILSTALESLGANPGFFIGGIPKNFSVMGRGTDSKYFVAEGDEYDTAFFDKKAKFLNYFPNYLIITSIEFDHADIYDNLEQIMNAFQQLVESMPEGGIIVYNKDDKNVLELIENSNIRAKVVSYGASENSKYFYHKVHIGGETALSSYLSFFIGEDEVRLKVPGKHNILNAVSVYAVLKELGFEGAGIAKGISEFKGVKRRQDIIYTIGDITVIDDFAHHPTAVDLTIEAIREWYPSRRLWAIFEPRTATTRTNQIEPELIKALQQADRVIIAPVNQPERVEEANRLSPSRVSNVLHGMGVISYAPENVDKIIETLMKEVHPKDVILIMSNGGFGGIYKKLKEQLKEVFNGVLENRG